MRCFKVLFSSKPGADGPGCLERSQHPPGMVNGIRVPGAGSEHCFVPCCLRAPLGGGACVECGLQDTVPLPETGSSAPESCQAGQGVLLTSLPSFGRLPPPGPPSSCSLGMTPQRSAQASLSPRLADGTSLAVQAPTHHPEFVLASAIAAVPSSRALRGWGPQGQPGRVPTRV